MSYCIESLLLKITSGFAGGYLDIEIEPFIRVTLIPEESVMGSSGYRQHL